MADLSGYAEAEPALRELTAEQIDAMSYNELIALVRETNRPPGGVRSIAEIARRAFIQPGKRVLEVGTSTGITAIELARLTGCEVVAIDVNELSLAEARRRAAAVGVSSSISFERCDVTNTGFEDASFDVVFCGNVTSLVTDRERALSEYTRVLRDGGFIAAIPMYYIERASVELLQEVSRAIQVDIEPLDREFWVDFFVGERRVLWWSEDHRFDELSDETVNSFVDVITSRPHLASLNPDASRVLAEKYRNYMHLFRTNLAHMGFSLLLTRKDEADEPELFTARRVE